MTLVHGIERDGTAVLRGLASADRDHADAKARASS
jgi:hypothetical protein